MFLVGLLALGGGYRLAEGNLKLSSEIKQKENYLEIIQGDDTTKYYKINDSTYCINPEKSPSQNKLNKLEKEFK